jgi:hypothetical protein
VTAELVPCVWKEVTVEFDLACPDEKVASDGRLQLLYDWFEELIWNRDVLSSRGA